MDDPVVSSFLLFSYRLLFLLLFLLSSSLYDNTSNNPIRWLIMNGEGRRLGGVRFQRGEIRRVWANLELDRPFGTG